jgi:hypothetical protein
MAKTAIALPLMRERPVHPDYSYALEKRKEWLDYANSTNFQGDLANSAQVYREVLQKADTYVMNRKFCELVDLARRTVPDDLAFENDWLPTPSGWLWCVTPFEVPELDKAMELVGERRKVGVSAIGWDRLTPRQIEQRNLMVDEALKSDKVREANDNPQNRLYLRHLKPGAAQFSVFVDYDQLGGRRRGFSMWSYFVLNPGDEVGTRIELFEETAKDSQDAGTYGGDKRVTSMLHECRWIYTALHLMSQRLTTKVHRDATRGTRKRFERDQTPIAPEYRIVTLRRMEEEREKVPQEKQTVEWQWSWRVTGFWRNQWYPVEQEHKRIWIEEYIKGDLTKPLKPTKTLYRVAK